MISLLRSLFFFFFFVFLALLPASVLGGGLVVHDETFVPDHVLYVSAQNISQACNNRYSTVVNGTSPGPPIRLIPGRSAWIRVYNLVPDANLTMVSCFCSVEFPQSYNALTMTTFSFPSKQHWHGISQHMAEFSDGSPLGTQWPIPSNSFFDYEVRTTAKDAGTYLYHSHVGMQALTVTGPLIVEDCGPPPYDYDDERTLLFHDHFQQTDLDFEHGLLAGPLVFGGEVLALMMNGQGVAINHTAGEVPGDQSCQLPVLEVEPDTTYRFRFIGATSLSHAILAFEGHENLTVIAVDGGQYTQPATTNLMQLGSGQRFDVLFRTKSEAELAAAGKTDFFIQFETRDRPSVFQGYGILRYQTTSVSVSITTTTTPPAAPVLTLPNTTYSWLENTLQPLVPDPAFPALDEVTRRIVVTVRQIKNETTNQTIWTLNDLTWNELVAYPVPLLVDIYLRGDAAMPDYAAALANQGWDPRTKSFPARLGEVLEIVFQNTGSLVGGNGGVDVHPFHAHGEHPFDLGSGDGVYDAEAVEAARVASGFEPVRRDTTMLYRYVTKTTAGAPAGWRAWRYRVSTPGVWMVHCHTLQHMVMGEFLFSFFFFFLLRLSELQLGSNR